MRYNEEESVYLITLSFAVLSKCIGINLGGSYELNRVLPEKIDTSHGIYIEGENYILNISDKEKYDISFDEIEEELLLQYHKLNHNTYK